MKRSAILFLFFFFSALLKSQTGKQLIKATDMLHIKSISDVTLNKEGTKAAFTVTSIEPDGDSRLDYKYVNQIYVAPSDGSTAARQLTTKEYSGQNFCEANGWYDFLQCSGCLHHLSRSTHLIQVSWPSVRLQPQLPAHE